MTGPEIHTVHGPVQGLLDAGVARFRGIPFAASTAGPNRFAPPQPPAPWTEVRDATEAGPIAPQNPSILEQMLGAGDPVVGEDCLTVNVFAPASADGAIDPSAGLPVLFWIHGGGFLTGTGSIPWYDGANLAARGAVVVSCNYRLGVLGFLHLEEIADGFAGSGNLGLLDQIAALEWVRDNIAAFGGDPDRVTIFGESAGAMSVGTLLAIPAARGLFHRAILQSGASSHVFDAAAATGAARKFLAELGVDPSDLSALRDVSVEDMLAAQARFTASVSFEEGLPLLPVVDGAVLPGDPLSLVAAGSAAGIDVVVGTTTEEIKLFLLMEPSLQSLDAATLAQRADDLFVAKGRAPGEALAVYREGHPDASNTDLLVAMLTDHTFRIPAIEMVQAHVGGGHGSAWMYLFAFQSPAFGGALGACHALDVPFVWDNLDAQGAEMFAGELTPDVRALSHALGDAWVAFARDGVPAADGFAEWPKYDLERRATIRLDAGHSEIVDDPSAAERLLWA